MNRRVFLIGTAAALAVVKIPELDAPAIGVIEKPDWWRSIHGLEMSVLDPKNEAITFDIGRMGETSTLLRHSMNACGILAWSAVSEYSSLIMPANTTLRINCTPAIKGAQVVCYSRDRSGNGFVEHYLFDGDGFVAAPPQPMLAQSIEWKPEHWSRRVVDLG